MNRQYKIILYRILKEENLEKARIIFVPPGKINCVALIYREGNSHNVLCQDNLPDTIKLFVILHEFGHLALGELNQNPFREWSEAVEKKVNFWALEKLEPYLNREFYKNVKAAFEISEDHGFTHLKKEALWNIVTN